MPPVRRSRQWRCSGRVGQVAAEPARNINLVDREEDPLHRAPLVAPKLETIGDRWALALRHEVHPLTEHGVDLDDRGGEVGFGFRERLQLERIRRPDDSDRRDARCEVVSVGVDVPLCDAERRLRYGAVKMQPKGSWYSGVSGRRCPNSPSQSAECEMVRYSGTNASSIETRSRRGPRPEPGAPPPELRRISAASAVSLPSLSLCHDGPCADDRRVAVHQHLLPKLYVGTRSDTVHSVSNECRPPSRVPRRVPEPRTWVGVAPLCPWANRREPLRTCTKVADTARLHFGKSVQGTALKTRKEGRHA